MGLSSIVRSIKILRHLKLIILAVKYETQAEIHSVLRFETEGGKTAARRYRYFCSSWSHVLVFFSGKASVY